MSAIYSGSRTAARKEAGRKIKNSIRRGNGKNEVYS